VNVVRPGPSRTKRWFTSCAAIGYRWRRLQVRQAEAAADVEDSLWLAYAGVFRALRDPWIFFAGAHRPMTGGAALGPDVFRFFHALGVNLKQIYGADRGGRVSTIHRDRGHQF